MQVKDRIKELRRVRAQELRPNPRNWRTHPSGQRNALRGILAEIGYADALLVRELPDGSLELIDGHLRAETTPDMRVPVLVLDVDEEEAHKILLTHDPLTSMADAKPNDVKSLLGDVKTHDEAVQELLQSLDDAVAAPALSWESVSTRPEVPIKDSYEIVVECRDEAEQEDLFERLRKEGYRCRVLTL